MADFTLVSERGTEVIKSAPIAHEVLVTALEKKKPGWSSVLSEVMENEMCILNCHQAKELLIDFCRLDLSDVDHWELLDILPMLVECIDRIHLKIIVQL